MGENVYEVSLLKRAVSLVTIVVISLILTLSSFETPFTPVGLGGEEGKGKVVVVVLDRIGWKDIEEAYTPNIDRLIKMGGIGLMTTNTAGARSCSNAFVTMGAGARATGSSYSGLAFKAQEIYKGERVADLYYQITGEVAKPNSIVNFGISQVHRNNAKRPYPVNRGALGTALGDEGYQIAVFGNSDTPDKDQRYLVSMMMDHKGVVPLGDVGEPLIIKDGTRPFGMRINSDKMVQAIDDVWDRADVVAVQWGDTSRVEEFRHMVMEEMLEQHRQQALEEGDAFIGWLINRLDLDRDLIMIITPLGPLRELQANNRLTPIILAGKGVDRGWLTSASTHREGVVTNLDVGATILHFFEVSPLHGQTGLPIVSLYNKEGFEGLMNFNQRLVEIFNQRSFLIRSFVLLLTIVVVIALFLLFFKYQYLNLIKPCILFIMIVPLVYLFLTVVHQPNLVGSIILSLIMALTATAMVWYIFPRTLDQILVVCFAMALALLLDQWTGGTLIQGSPLGYDVISGARFYGLGNEYMGALVGATCIGGTAAVERLPQRPKVVLWGVFGWLILVLATLALPWWGANVGGAISAFIAFGVLTILMTDRRITWRHGIGLAIILIILLTGVFALDSIRAVESQSHIGQTVKLIQQNGVGEIFNIFYRKISMNLRLFRYTIWTRVFLTSLLAMIILFYRPAGIFKDVVEQYPFLSYGFISGIVGSIAALLTNDSGIVAAATSMIYVGLSFILVIIQRLQEIIREKGAQHGSDSGT